MNKNTLIISIFLSTSAAVWILQPPGAVVLFGFPSYPTVQSIKHQEITFTVGGLIQAYPIWNKCRDSWDDEIKCEWVWNWHSHTKCTDVIQTDFCALVCRLHASASSRANSDRMSLMCLQVSFQRARSVLGRGTGGEAWGWDWRMAQCRVNVSLILICSKGLWRRSWLPASYVTTRLQNMTDKCRVKYRLSK